MRPDWEWGTYVDRSHAQTIRDASYYLAYIILIVWCLDVLCTPYMHAYTHLLIKCIPR